MPDTDGNAAMSEATMNEVVIRFISCLPFTSLYRPAPFGSVSDKNGKGN